MTPQFVVCSECGTQLAPSLLDCPSCGRLLHARQLTELAQAAGSAEQAGNVSAALANWRQALPLIPPGTRQRTATEQKISELSARAGTEPSAKQPLWKRISSLGPVGVAAPILGKAKFLLLGFSKLGTLLSFVVGFSIYWTIWGWRFALCFLLSIYIHEMGHVAALHRYGIPASPPMFIPGLGALVRLKQAPASPREDARVGLAGPLWGLAAALICLALYAITGNAFWAAVARAGAWLNLFNLFPVWQLDGSRGIRSLDRARVWTLAVLAAGLWAIVNDGLLILIAILLAVRASMKRGEVKPDDPQPDWIGLAQFSGLLVALSLLCLIPLPKP